QRSRRGCGRRGGACVRSGADHGLPGPMKGFRYTVVFGALALLVLFLLYPLSLVLDASLRVNGTGTFTLANYAQIFASKYYLNSIANSLLAAAFATVGATLMGNALGVLPA